MPSDMGICFLSLAALDWESISEYGFGRNTMSGTFVIVNAGRERESVFTLQTKRGWIQICSGRSCPPLVFQRTLSAFSPTITKISLLYTLRVS